MKAFAALLLASLIAGSIGGFILLGGFGSFIGIILSFTFGTVFGLPTYLLLLDAQWTKDWNFAIAGAIVVLPLILFLVLAGVKVGWLFTLTLMLTGAGAGLVFWWAAISMPDSQSTESANTDVVQ